MPFIKSVMPLNDWRLFVEMATGSVIVADFSHKLETARFGDFKNMDIFRSVVTDGETLSWGNGRLTLTARELMNTVFVDIE